MVSHTESPGGYDPDATMIRSLRGSTSLDPACQQLLWDGNSEDLGLMWSSSIWVQAESALHK